MSRLLTLFPRPVLRILAGVFILYSFGFGYFIHAMPGESSVKNLDVDALVVFTGGTNRIDALQAYMKEGFKGDVLITGVNPDVKPSSFLTELSPAEIAIIELDYDAQTTRQNVAITQEWVVQKGVKSIGLITNHYHMPRSLMLLAREMPGLRVVPLAVLPKHMAFTDALHEYHKYILTWVR